jgi:hypothetical protein
MNAILFSTDGTKKNIKVNSFVEARKIVCNYDANGLAEIVRLLDGNLFMIDEEGKFKNYPINKMATSIAHLNEAIYPHDCLVGDVLLFQDANEFEELEYGFE